MTDRVTPVNIKVLGKDYRIACAEDEHDELLESARYLDQKMCEVRDTGRVVGDDRIAVMAALNIAHELAQSNRQNGFASRDINDQLTKVQNKIDAILDSKDIE